MNLQELMDAYHEEGLTRELAASRVCQDIVLKAIADMIRILIFDDSEMYENTMDEIINRLNNTFKDEQYLSRVSGSRQRWIDNDIHEISKGIHYSF